MLDYLKTWMQLRGDKRAVTMLEYGILAAVIAAAVVTAAALIGTNLNSVFGYVSGKLVTPSS